MIPLNVRQEISVKTPSCIVLIVVDGLGGLPVPGEGKTELELARTPQLDQLAARSALGLSTPLEPGLTPGSGPAHLALFGYDALRHNVGRGALSALGVGFTLGPNDLAARLNFCTVEEGQVTDRRAGRIPTEINELLCAKLRAAVRLPKEFSDIKLHLLTEEQYRAVVVFRGPGLDGRLSDSDPQHTGAPPLPVAALAPAAQRSAALANAFIAEAGRILADEHPANMVLLRGFAQHPSLPQFADVFKLTPAAIAAYPMYRGLARLAGMAVLGEPHALAEEVVLLRDHWQEHDFFYVHVKPTDSAGEDGDAQRKAAVIEELDALLPEVLALGADVLIITGDHSTPSTMRSHSWHPLPLLLYSAHVIPEGRPGFSERAAARGQLGPLRHGDVMDLAMAHALKYDKFRA